MNNEKAYKKFIFSKTNVQLTEAFLERININKVDNFLDGEYINDINLSTKIDILEDRKAKGYLKTIIESKNKETDSVVLTIELVYSGLFEATEDYDSESLREWVDIQLVSQLLPYTRTIIANITAHMDVMPMFIPTLDVLQSIKKNHQKEGH